MPAYLKHLKADYAHFATASRIDSLVPEDKWMLSGIGTKYARVVHVTPGSRGAHSFIVLHDCGVCKDNSDKTLQLRAGDILKAASWNRPALNFVRGNLFDKNYGTISWCGA